MVTHARQRAAGNDSASGAKGPRQTPRRHSPGRFASAAELQRWLETSRRTPRLWRDARWQQRNALGAVDLARLGMLKDEAAMRAALRYPVVVTPYYLSLADWSNPLDPIRRQWVPDGREMMRLCSDAQDDPFQESAHAPVPGLVHRFPDRVLLMVSRCCATRCRHCTRKNRLDAADLLAPTAAGRASATAYIATHPGIREVILSGGDPLLLADPVLLRWVRTLAAMPQIDAVRIGTRVPCVMPMRITAGLARALGATGKVWINTQFNHANELTPESARACAQLVQAGIPVSNQSVLLAGVNDSIEAMEALCRGLQRIRVRPYYVFVCDPVTGTLHFRTSLNQARRIERALACRVGGLALPRFVVDAPSAPAKKPV